MKRAVVAFALGFALLGMLLLRVGHNELPVWFPWFQAFWAGVWIERGFNNLNIGSSVE